MVLKTSSVKMKSIQGNVIPVIGETSVSLDIGNHKGKQIFYVCDIPEIIFGIDLLNKWGTIIHLPRKEVWFTSNHSTTWTTKVVPCAVENIEYKVNSSVEVNKETPLIGCSNDSTMLPPRSQIMIHVSFNTQSHKEALLEQYEDTPSNIVVARSLNTISSNTPVRICNIGNEGIWLEQGTPLVKATLGELSIEKIISPGFSDEEVHVNSCTTSDTNPRLTSVNTTLPSIPSHLNKEQQESLQQVLMEYSYLFAQSSNDLGCTHLITHDIDTGTARPIKQPARRKPLKAREIEDQHVEDMLNNGVVKPSQSAWGSPVVLVKKKDGSIRFCVDYRRLNAITVGDAYPLPRIDDTLDALAGNKWFSTIDLQSGYWQVPLTPEASDKSAFNTGRGLFQFTVMPFGLCNAPATFSRLMDQVLSGLNWIDCLLYLDDVIIFGKTWDQHLSRLRLVFSRLAEAGLKLKPSKCELACSKVKYLGHIVSEAGVETNPETLRAVEAIQAPLSTQTEVKSFLGLCGFYRRFIKGFSSIAAPLHALTSLNKPRKVDWTNECQTAFNTLKSSLLTAPIVAYPDPDKPFILYTDASMVGLGAVLAQKQDGKERVICYASRTLHGGEKRYAATKREALAVVWAVKKFHHYLWGTKFTIITDHQALAWMNECTKADAMYARWGSLLENYDFTIHHRAGIRIGHADGLSRLPVPPHEEEAQELDDDALFIGSSQIDDPTASELQDIEYWLLSGGIYPRGTLPNALAKTKERLCMVNGLVYLDNRQVLADSEWTKKVKELHEDDTRGAHFSWPKTLAKAEERWYCSRMKELTKKICDSCQSCQVSKPLTRRYKNPSQPIITSNPWEIVALDLMGPMRETNNGKKYILTAIDLFSKFLISIPLKRITADSVCKALQDHLVGTFGAPEVFLTDRGAQFLSKTMYDWCKLYNIECRHTTAWHPQGNGLCERVHRTLNEALRSNGVPEETWDEKVSGLTLAYNTMISSTTKFTPAEVMTGRKLRLPRDDVAPKNKCQSLSEYVVGIQTNLQQIYEKVRCNQNKATASQKQQADKGVRPIKYSIGQQVYHVYRPHTGETRRFAPKWEGPYTVVDVKSPQGVTLDYKGSPKVFHVDHLKPYIPEEFPPSITDSSFMTEEECDIPEPLVTQRNKDTNSADIECIDNNFDLSNVNNIRDHVDSGRENNGSAEVFELLNNNCDQNEVETNICDIDTVNNKDSSSLSSELCGGRELRPRNSSVKPSVYSA